MTIEQKIELLREEWRSNPERRVSIELQVKVLKLGTLAPVKLLVKHENRYQTPINQQTISGSPV